MSCYHVFFFKNLLTSDGHQRKCLQQEIEVRDLETAAEAAEYASRTFEALRGVPNWNVYADAVEVILADPARPRGRKSGKR